MRRSILNILPVLHIKRVESFLISLCVVISLFIAAIFIFLDNNISRLMHQRVREQAVTYLDLINHTKKWNFDYGGVYVLKQGEVRSNAYLDKLGVKPDITCADGRVLTIRNHAIMTSEISRRSEKTDGVTYRLVSMSPLAPGNHPDSFEQQGLHLFSPAKQEYFQMVDDPVRPLFRYMAPLYADSSCLGCHRGVGIRSGDILGAVSISIPVRQLLEETYRTRLISLLAAVFLIGLLISITYFMTLNLARDLKSTQDRLRTMALTDELTGLNNRRQLMSRLEEEFQRSMRLGEPVCLISLDIDHFKHINDTYGHPFGDLVLKRVAERMQNSVRPYDIVGRVGGEEFIIVAPATPSHEAVLLADRIIATISREQIGEGPTQVTVTASAGVAVIDPVDSDIDYLIRRADNSLYQAKQAGRNRVAGP